MLGCLTLFWRSLRLSSFLFILFLFFSSLLNSFLWFCLLPHLFYLLPPLFYYQFPPECFLSHLLHCSLYSDSFFFYFSRSLLNISCIFSILVSRLFSCNSILFSRFCIVFTIIILNSFQVDSLSLPLLFGLLGISPVPLPAGYSSVSSSCLYC